MSPVPHPPGGVPPVTDVMASIVPGPVPGHGLLRLQGDLDFVSASAVADHVAALLDGGCSDITLDMLEVPFCDVAGLKVLLRASAALEDRAGRVLIVSACPSLRLMLTMLPDMGFQPPQMVDA